MQKTEKNENDDYEKLLKALVITQTYLETLDEIKNTSSLYKGTLMKRIGTLNSHLEKSLGKKFTEIFNRDEKSFGVVIESIHAVAEWMSKNSMEDIFALAEAMKNNEIKFTENEK